MPQGWLSPTLLIWREGALRDETKTAVWETTGVIDWLRSHWFYFDSLGYLSLSLSTTLLFNWSTMFSAAVFFAKASVRLKLAHQYY